MQTGRAMHRNLGLVEICETCLAMQAMNPDPTSMFVKHDGDVKEVTRALVSASGAVSVVPEKKSPMRSDKEIQAQMDIKNMFLSAPENQIDLSVKPLIEAWDNPPTALQILRVLDSIVYSGGATGFVVSALDAMMRGTLEAEGQTYEQLVAKADWRHNGK